jgi:hypothetical protein
MYGGKEMKEKGYERAINEFVRLCKKKFGNNLVSIVLFGSHARGTATKYSDIDLLVIVKNLPDDWRERDRLVIALEHEVGSKYSIPITSIVASKREFLDGVEAGNALLFGISKGYVVLHDKEGLFPTKMEEFKTKYFLKLGTKEIRENVWRVPV